MPDAPVKPEDENGANHPEQQRAPQVGTGGLELTEQQDDVSEVPVADAPKDKD